MQKEVRGDVVKNINEKRAGIRTGKLYAIDTSFCDNQLRVMMFETNKMYVLLEELKSYISDFRLKIPDITEESFACGAYLLLCTALKHFYAVTLLAQQ